MQRLEEPGRSHDAHGFLLASQFFAVLCGGFLPCIARVGWRHPVHRCGNSMSHLLLGSRVAVAVTGTVTTAGHQVTGSDTRPGASVSRCRDRGRPGGHQDEVTWRSKFSLNPLKFLERNFNSFKGMGFLGEEFYLPGPLAEVIVSPSF